MPVEFEASGTSSKALFTLKLRRGEGMALLSMNWEDGTPSDDFVGFAIESAAWSCRSQTATWRPSSQPR